MQCDTAKPSRAVQIQEFIFQLHFDFSYTHAILRGDEQACARDAVRKAEVGVRTK
jgi:hypothetical protein